MLKLSVLSGILGISFLLVSMLLWDGGNIQIFDVSKLGSYIYSLKIETTQQVLLDEVLDRLYLSGSVLEFLTPYYYLFVVLVSSGISLIFFCLHQYYDYIVLKKRLFLPEFWSAIRRSFYVFIILLFYFYSKLANLSFVIFIAFCILIISFELLFYTFFNKKNKEKFVIKEEETQSGNSLEGIQHRPEVE